MLKTALGQSPVFRYAKHISTSVNFFFFLGGGEYYGPVRMCC